MSTTLSLQEAMDDLTKVFPPHPLDPERAFDAWGGTYGNVDDFKAGVRGRPWTALEPGFLEFHHDSLFFLGPESFADYLPAFLAAVVRRDEALSALPMFLLGALTRSEEDPEEAKRFDARIAPLTHEQRRAVARALEVLEASHEFPHNQRDVARPLDSYWRALADRS